jgi:diacylglycerol kinase (ATP)
MERYTQESFRKQPPEIEEESGKRQKYLVVINPVSRGGNALKEGTWLLKQLGRLGVRHEAFITENPGHATKIVEEWINRVDVVVAVGGDGTVNEVVNGMLADPKCDRALAVFPAGTADDFCHNVGIPRDRNRALMVMLADNERKIDLLKYNGQYAIVQLGVGVDAEVAYRTLSHKRVRIPAYFAVGINIVFKERLRNSPRALHIESDTTVYDGKFLLAVFGNAPLYGRFVYWMPEAKMDDGIINMSALRPMSPLPAWYLLMRCFNPDFRSDRVLYDASERFTVELREESFLQVDGEVYKYGGGERLDITVARKALRVRVPAETGGLFPYAAR